MGIIQKNNDEEELLGLNKKECSLIMSLVAENHIQIKDIQIVYDLVLKLSDHFNK